MGTELVCVFSGEWRDGLLAAELPTAARRLSVAHPRRRRLLPAMRPPTSPVLFLSGRRQRRGTGTLLLAWPTGTSLPQLVPGLRRRVHRLPVCGAYRRFVMLFPFDITLQTLIWLSHHLASKSHFADFGTTSILGHQSIDQSINHYCFVRPKVDPESWPANNNNNNNK